MFEDCGWEYITTYVGYSYFRKPVASMKEAEEIFFDGIVFTAIAVLLGMAMVVYILVTVRFGIRYMGHLRRLGGWS